MNMSKQRDSGLQGFELLHGDCLEVMKNIPDHSVDMIMSDPPYGMTKCKWDTVIDLPRMWEQLKRVVRPNGAIVMTAGQPFASALVMSNVAQYKATWYWKKERGTNFVQAKRYPMKVIEECLLFCYGTPNYNPKMREVTPYTHVLPKPKKGSSQHMSSEGVDENGKRIVKKYTQAYPINVLEVSRDNMSKGKSLHPTQKPVPLMEYLIKTYTNEGETVLDFVMGSGTTGVACVNTDRQFIGIELDDGYFDIAAKRIQAANPFAPFQTEKETDDS